VPTTLESFFQSADLLLFSRIKSGDEHALRDLFKKYYASLCTFAYVFIKNKEQAEELVADVFIKIWEKREKIEIASSLKAYLYVATKNQALANLQKSNIFFQQIDQLPPHLAINYITPEDTFTSGEFFRDLSSIIDTLPAQCRIIFIMHKIDGFSYREIADILQISVKTVENQMGKALKFVREELLKKPFSLKKAAYLLPLTL
jgi:RNA polymerase sigma-70 factor, ECF subfamily